MIKRLITLLAALLVLGFVVAGCGDDESDSAGNGDTTAAETATDTVAGDETVTDDATDTVTEKAKKTKKKETETAKGGDAGAPTAPAQAKKNCERGMRSAKQLDEDVREKLVGLCDKATSDDPDDRREAAQEFCRTMVDSLYGDGRPGRDRALESCEKAGGQQPGQR